MRDKPTLTGDRVILRAPTPADVAARFALGNSPEIEAMFGGNPAQTRPITDAAAQAWVDSYLNDPLAWVIDAEGEMIGGVRLHSVNHADKRANIAIGILSKAHLSHGYGTEAMRVLARHAFGKLGLHRLSCRVLAFNERAIAAYEKIGFVQEGRERQSALIGLEWHDDVIMGLLKDDLR
jgi:RimJ/RimL family protein N-acetyltransferase